MVKAFLQEFRMCIVSTHIVGSRLHQLSHTHACTHVHPTHVHTHTLTHTHTHTHRENSIKGVFDDQTFCVDHDKFGRLTQHDLKPNGQDIPVTDENKTEYVHLYVQWRFQVGVEKQFMALQKGFHELIPAHLLKQFDEKELELIVSGLGSVDVNDWRSNTRLKNCTNETDVIQWFWKVQ